MVGGGGKEEEEEEELAGVAYEEAQAEVVEDAEEVDDVEAGSRGTTVE